MCNVKGVICGDKPRELSHKSAVPPSSKELISLFGFMARNLTVLVPSHRSHQHHFPIVSNL